MSSNSKEYAISLYDLACSEHKQQEIYNDLLTISEAFDSEIKSFFIHPLVKLSEKKKVLQEVIKDNDLLLHFFYVLLENQRLDLLEMIKEDYQELLNQENKIEKVIVYSKEVLKPTYLEQLKTKLEQKFNFIAEIENVIDHQIIGGIKIVFGSKVIDETINNHLSGLVNYLKI